MTNTRHATSGAALSAERYMSSPEFAELRGIPGIAVATKAATILNPRKRRLLFFLQALSLRIGGLKQFTKDFLAEFPERLGSPTMHHARIKPGKTCSPETAEKIINELHLWCSFNDSDVSLWPEGTHVKMPHRPKAAPTSERFIELCAERAEKELPDFITELCVNPNLHFSTDGDSEATAELEREAVGKHYAEPEKWKSQFWSADVPWFSDIVGALFELQRRFKERARKEFVMTSIAREVFDSLDFCRETGKPVAIIGNARIGKTTAVEAWCNQHLGEARFVSLSGLTSRTAILRSIAKVCGIASTYTRTSGEMQARVEDFFQRSRLILAVDEAHFLLGQSVRIYTRPEMIDWLNTAFYNHRVPFALTATPQFGERLSQYEKQTGWNADQFKGRLKRMHRLPEEPTKEDLFAVARKLLPDSDAPTIKVIVGYALASKRHMPAVVDLVDEATLLARKAGRDRVKYEDVDCALEAFVKPSDQAKACAFNLRGKPFAQPQKAVRRPIAAPVDRAPVPAPALGETQSFQSSRLGSDPAPLASRVNAEPVSS